MVGVDYIWWFHTAWEPQCTALQAGRPTTGCCQ